MRKPREFSSRPDLAFVFCQAPFLMTFATGGIPHAGSRQSTNNKCWRGCVEKGTFLYCWLECKLVQPLWRTVWRFLKKLKIELPSVQFSSVSQSCPTLCNPMNHSTPGLPVHHQLPEFTQTHVHRVCDAIQPSHPLLSPSPPAPNPSQHQGLFQ